MGLARIFSLTVVLVFLSAPAIFAHGIGMDWQQQARELSIQDKEDLDQWGALNQQVRELSQKGQFDSAAEVARKALELAQKSQYLGTVGAEGVSLCNLASCYYNQAQNAQAERTFEAALAFFEKRYGADHASVAAILNNLASVHQRQGHLAQAEPLYKRALEIDEKALGRDHPNVAVELKNLAGLYRSTHRDGEAVKLEQRAAAIEAVKR